MFKGNYNSGQIQRLFHVRKDTLIHREKKFIFLPRFNRRNLIVGNLKEQREISWIKLLNETKLCQ